MAARTLAENSSSMPLARGKEREHKVASMASTRDADVKLPLHWFDVHSRPIVSFAGVWRPVEKGAVFAFLTCEPKPLVGRIHPTAMPVLLDEADDERWLTCPFEDAVALAKPYLSQLISVTQVGAKKTVDLVGNDDRGSAQLSLNLR